MEFGFNTEGVPQDLLDQVSLRPYREGDEKGILATFHAVFGVQRPLSEWNWTFRDNPEGTRIYLAVDPAGTVAGHWAGIPVRVATRWGIRRFVQIVDTFIHPDYRKGRHAGPGVFAKLGQTGIRHWMGDLGDSLLYGYPVPQAEKMGQRFLGYRRLAVVDYLCRPIRPIPPASSPPESGLAVTRVEHLDAEFDSFFDRSTDPDRCLLVRDRTYLQWRYADHPQACYEIYAARRHGELAGWMVLRPEHDSIANVCTIADWLVPDGAADVTEALFGIANARGKECNRWAVLAVFPAHGPEHAACIRHGFDLVPSAKIMERRLTVWNSPACPELQDDYLAARWYYTLGDSDLV